MKEKYLFIPPKPKFTNRIIDKKELKKLMAWAFSNYGTGRASYMADRLKELGFHYATKAGISLSVEDLRVPPTKRDLLYKTNDDDLHYFCLLTNFLSRPITSSRHITFVYLNLMILYPRTIANQEAI